MPLELDELYLKHIYGDFWYYKSCLPEAIIYANEGICKKRSLWYKSKQVFK